MDHSAHSCAHNALKFCSHCNTVWCQACKVEWRQNPICLLNHYPSYYSWPQPQPYQTIFGGSFGASVADSTVTNRVDNVTLTSCAHGGD